LINVNDSFIALGTDKRNALIGMPKNIYYRR